jgi:hypothetical protein
MIGLSNIANIGAGFTTGFTTVFNIDKDEDEEEISG